MYKDSPPGVKPVAAGVPTNALRLDAARNLHPTKGIYIPQILCYTAITLTLLESVHSPTVMPPKMHWFACA
jgi:hypothetical protein